MNAHERMMALCKYKGMNKSEFERFAKLPKTAITHIHDHISPNIFRRVMACMPEVNPFWLLMGQGEMLRSEAQMAQQRRLDHMDELEKRVAALEQELSRARAAHAEELSSARAVHTEEQSRARAENEALNRRVAELQSLLEIQKAKADAYYDIILALRPGTADKTE